MMAVNYANLFMSAFEDQMIDAYRKEHGCVPLSWVRYTDDIFFLWNDDIHHHSVTASVQKIRRYSSPVVTIFSSSYALLKV